MNSNIILWQNPEQIEMPKDLEKVEDVMSYVNNGLLKPIQQQQIVNAYNQKSYEMSAEYAWKKAISKLRKSLQTLGTDFVGELAGRSDVSEYTPIDEFLTDRKAIDIAEQLGIIGKTGALKLRQHYELMNHFISGEADEDMGWREAFDIIYDSVLYVLCEQDENVALAFSDFRERLLGDTIKIDDNDVRQILAAPLFYKRTVCIILLNAIKKEKGIRQEHALTNLNILIPEIWDSIADTDKYNIGLTYSMATSYGDNVASKGLKQALMKVRGFDYVPETTRSTEFKNQAKKVIDTHYAFNNFYNEPDAVRSLAKLGSIIPAPAFQDCIDAYIVVSMGNWYNVSIEAAPIAEKELLKVSKDRWHYFFAKLIHQDQYVLDHIDHPNQIARLSNILAEVGYTLDNTLPKGNQDLLNAIIAKDYVVAKNIALKMYNTLRYA